MIFNILVIVSGLPALFQFLALSLFLCWLAGFVRFLSLGAPLKELPNKSAIFRVFRAFPLVIFYLALAPAWNIFMLFSFRYQDPISLFIFSSLPAWLQEILDFRHSAHSAQLTVLLLIAACAQTSFYLFLRHALWYRRAVSLLLLCFVCFQIATLCGEEGDNWFFLRIYHGLVLALALTLISPLGSPLDSAQLLQRWNILLSFLCRALFLSSLPVFLLLLIWMIAGLILPNAFYGLVYIGVFSSLFLISFIAGPVVLLLYLSEETWPATRAFSGHGYKIVVRGLFIPLLLAGSILCGFLFFFSLLNSRETGYYSGGYYPHSFLLTNKYWLVGVFPLTALLSWLINWEPSEEYNRLGRTLRTKLFLICLPALLLLFLEAYLNLSSQGLLLWLYYLLAYLIWMTIVLAYLSFSSKPIVNSLGISIALISLLTAAGPLSGHDLVLAGQRAHLKRLLAKADIDPRIEVHELKKVNERLSSDIGDVLRLLIRDFGPQSVRDIFAGNSAAQAELESFLYNIENGVYYSSHDSQENVLTAIGLRTIHQRNYSAEAEPSEYFSYENPQSEWHEIEPGGRKFLVGPFTLSPCPKESPAPEDESSTLQSPYMTSGSTEAKLDYPGMCVYYSAWLNRKWKISLKEKELTIETRRGNFYQIDLSGLVEQVRAYSQNREESLDYNKAARRISALTVVSGNYKITLLLKGLSALHSENGQTIITSIRGYLFFEKVRSKKSERSPNSLNSQQNNSP